MDASLPWAWIVMTSTLEQILAEVMTHTGLDFAQYRRQIVVGRVADRMAALGCATTEVYWDRLQGDQTECHALAEAISINVSRFFRNPIVFEILAQRVLPELLEKKRAAGSREFRIWSAGCASGEEPYSVAILLREVLERDEQDWDIHIFATDIDQGALEQARKGRYSEDLLGDTKFGLIRKYFRPRGDAFEVLAELRDMVMLSKDDLTSPALDAPADSIFGAFDLILCRNVLIYLSQDFQQNVCKKLSRSLVGGGYLVLGEAERLPKDMDGGFTTLGDVNRIYRKHG